MLPMEEAQGAELAVGCAPLLLSLSCRRAHVPRKIGSFWRAVTFGKVKAVACGLVKSQLPGSTYLTHI